LTHETIRGDGWVETYVRRELTPQQSEAFEEHYFTCRQCFEEVQEMEKFIAGLHQAGDRGMLNTAQVERRWLMPAFVFATAAALLLTAGLSYLVLSRPLAHEVQLAQNVPTANPSPQANVPVVILNADRAADSRRQLSIGDIGDAVFWIDVPPQPPGTKFDLTISSPGNELKSIQGLERNADGALAFSVPASDLAPGTYVLRLSQNSRMVAQYSVDVIRK
jgi:hypothetical protein